jgi:hypothetical protein
VTVRLPDPTDASVLSNRLLVIAPVGATKLRVSGSTQQTVPLVGAVGVITVKVPATLTVLAIDITGKALAQMSVDEADADGLILGQALIQRW